MIPIYSQFSGVKVKGQAYSNMLGMGVLVFSNSLLFEK